MNTRRDIEAIKDKLGVEDDPNVVEIVLGPGNTALAIDGALTPQGREAAAKALAPPCECFDGLDLTDCLIGSTGQVQRLLPGGKLKVYQHKCGRQEGRPKPVTETAKGWRETKEVFS